MDKFYGRNGNCPSTSGNSDFPCHLFRAYILSFDTCKPSSVVLPLPATKPGLAIYNGSTKIRLEIFMKNQAYRVIAGCFTLIVFLIWHVITHAIGWGSMGADLSWLISALVTAASLCMWSGITLVMLHKLKNLSQSREKIVKTIGIILVIPGVMGYAIIGYGVWQYIHVHWL